MCIRDSGESEHTLRLYGVASVTQKCNSYAAPFVTAYIEMCIRDSTQDHLVDVF